MLDIWGEGLWGALGRCAGKGMIVGHGESKGLCEQDKGVRKTKDPKNDLQLDVCVLSVVYLFMDLAHVWDVGELVLRSCWC